MIAVVLVSMELPHVVIKHLNCVEIKRNESETGSDILLVSDYFHTSNISQQNLKPDTNVNLYNKGLHNMFI